MEFTNERDTGSQGTPKLAPLLAVPDDVLVEIFYAFGAIKKNLRVPSLPPPPSPDSPAWPILLGSVCRKWRAVTLSTPRLWAGIRINISRPSNFVDAINVFQRFAARSGAYPLDIAITFSNVEDALMFSSEDMEQCQSLANALAASVDRWQHFRTNSHPSFLWKIEQAVVQGPTWSRPMLETLEIRSYGRNRQTWPDLGQNDDEAGLTMFAASPKLRYVNLGIGYSFHNDENLPIQLPWQQIEQLDRIDASSEGCMRLLRECPNLVRFNVMVPRQCGVRGPVDFLRHSLQSLEIWFDDESGASFDALFGSVELPSLLELRITFAEDEWQPLAHARLTRFLAATVTLQRLVLKLRHVSPEDFHSILKAVPSGLLELEFVHEREESAAPTIYSKQLLEELTLRTRDPPALLPNLRALSLLGALDMNIRAFTAIIRSRTWDNADAHRGAELQSLHMYIVESQKSLTIEDLQILKDCLTHRARFRVVHRGPSGGSRSLAFPDLM
ncbi:hypothetical protein FIBSPDRAFT_1044600 [Athelia psychrophila]|uniref:Uncharacterized protein n=1 Tax=Athelia psychrophila TaxID=1759441 RepID=A0A166JFI5_9AGAM|nr:hypothetical protein FIBSPDRAFT_1044600 [Fibularhizoctonia sp. CBS 109695]